MQVIFSVNEETWNILNKRLIEYLYEMQINSIKENVFYKLGIKKLTE